MTPRIKFGRHALIIEQTKRAAEAALAPVADSTPRRGPEITVRGFNE